MRIENYNLINSTIPSETVFRTISYDTLPAVFRVAITNRSNPSSLWGYLSGNIEPVPSGSVVIVSFEGGPIQVSTTKLRVDLSRGKPACSWIG